MHEQTGNEDINSKLYWDNRFTTDWKENNGEEQSRFFARIAIESLPEWFKQFVRLRQPSFCDWGCAFGDGTEWVREVLCLEKINGIDFSVAAIEAAVRKYPKIQFTTADLLLDENFPDFDIIFSSNTLEHFENPWEILNKLSRFATKHLVILIPFEERNRHFEHFYTFERMNIPLVAGSGHLLSHAATIDASIHSPSYWVGKQILLIYSSLAEIADLQLHLSDSALPGSDPSQFYRDLIADQSKLLNEKSAESEEKLDSIANVVANQAGLLVELQNKITGMEHRIGQLTDETAKMVSEKDSIDRLTTENQLLVETARKKELQLVELEIIHGNALRENDLLKQKTNLLNASLEDVKKSLYWRAGGPIRKLYGFLRRPPER